MHRTRAGEHTVSYRFSDSHLGRAMDICFCSSPETVRNSLPVIFIDEDVFESPTWQDLRPLRVAREASSDDNYDCCVGTYSDDLSLSFSSAGSGT